jgi:hypothetical protein
MELIMLVICYKHKWIYQQNILSNFFVWLEITLVNLSVIILLME